MSGEAQQSDRLDPRAEREWFITERWQEYEGEVRANLLRIAAIATFYLIHLVTYLSTAGSLAGEAAVEARRFHYSATAIALGWTMMAVGTLIAATTSLGLPKQVQAHLITKLAVARNAFTHNFHRVAVNRLEAFIGEVEVHRGTSLTDQQADRLIGQAKQIIGCV